MQFSPTHKPQLLFNPDDTGDLRAHAYEWKTYPITRMMGGPASPASPQKSKHPRAACRVLPLDLRMEVNGVGGGLFDFSPGWRIKGLLTKRINLGGRQGPVDSLGAPETSILSPPTFSAKDIQESNLAKGQVQQLPDPHMPCLTALTVPSHPNMSLSRASLTQMSSTWLLPW